jgi:hypothetical protein
MLIQGQLRPPAAFALALVYRSVLYKIHEKLPDISASNDVNLLPKQVSTVIFDSVIQQFGIRSIYSTFP